MGALIEDEDARRPQQIDSSPESAQKRIERDLRRAEEALEDETRILELLNKTGTILASTLDLRSVMQAVTDAATQISGAEFGALFHCGGDPGALSLYTLSGLSRAEFDQRFGDICTQPLFEPALRAEGVVWIGNVQDEQSLDESSRRFCEPARSARVCSYLAVPLILRSGQAVGSLLVGHHLPDVFSERSECLIATIAAQAAIAIDNARLYEEAKRAISAERDARAEVERVSLMKDEFLATLSHELRTPLNAVLGWAEMLLARAAPGTDVRRGLESISRNAHAQSQLIDDLLDMNRIISGKIRLDVQSADLASIIEASLESVRPSAEAKGIRLRWLLDPLPGPVFGDPHRLQQVVWNLLSNAVKFTPKGGAIDVMLRRVNSHIEITVCDSGAGIPAEFLPHLFERFRQLDSSTTRSHGGLGLGLSIVKQLVELHGGAIRAESAGEGMGATFVVSLPLRPVVERDAGEHPTTRRAPPRASEIDLAGVKVLLVDDEPDARELVKFVLAEAQAEVVTAGSADEGLELLKQARPDVVVSDIGMPERDGYQLMRSVRSLPPAEGGRTPAIALTAFARSEDRTRALLAGYQVHIAKPIEPRELVVTIGSLTGRAGTRS